jgi:hypothetical protein
VQANVVQITAQAGGVVTGAAGLLAGAFMMLFRRA